MQTAVGPRQRSNAVDLETDPRKPKAATHGSDFCLRPCRRGRRHLGRPEHSRGAASPLRFDSWGMAGDGGEGELVTIYLLITAHSNQKEGLPSCSEDVGQGSWVSHHVSAKQKGKPSRVSSFLLYHLQDSQIFRSGSLISGMDGCTARLVRHFCGSLKRASGI